MYITYKTVQWVRYKGEYVKRDKPPRKIPSRLRKPEFMPTKLVRISDMKVVNGSEIDEGYCTLSYSWNQSGDSIFNETTGKYERNDQGLHKIISPETNSIRQTLNSIQYGTSDNVKQVKFEGIIQRICQQFNIKYIWYDQMCINQENQIEKQNEISNMHHIYNNAECTVVLVPEFCGLDVYDDDQHMDEHLYNAEKMLHRHGWFKRLWTFEEAVKSKKLLIVGRNIHMWGEDLTYLDEINILNKTPSQLSVQEILYQAHQRTSTNDHDRVFALIHLFPDLIKEIDIDYDLPIEELIIQFYGFLAKKSIGILAFKKIGDDYASTIQKYKFLPSWTGVDGVHDLSIAANTTFRNYDIIGKRMMRVTCTYITNEQLTDNRNSLSSQVKDVAPIPNNDENSNYRLDVAIQLPGSNVTKNIRLSGANYGCNNNNDKDSIDSISNELRKLSKFMKIQKESFSFHCSSNHFYDKEFAEIYFDELTEEMIEPFTQYVILSGIPFVEHLNDFDSIYYYPVLKKKPRERYYKTIGVCSISRPEYLFSDCNLPRKTFLIQ